ncbi:hypothetical protein NDU88_001513 [Pleurodeles waltl]|uniref:Uncharacterized protein n=1 Tax=Pleurodeles waltl TaxID=8319 RepID=A0AAV7RD96_PLEWA|nr:hypothetical protein NDU88_001513 [Pleurodeles waltl]
MAPPGGRRPARPAPRAAVIGELCVTRRYEINARLQRLARKRAVSRAAAKSSCAEPIQKRSPKSYTNTSRKRKPFPKCKIIPALDPSIIFRWDVPETHSPNPVPRLVALFSDVTKP